jgi:hypothetical protein
MRRTLIANSSGIVLLDDLKETLNLSSDNYSQISNTFFAGSKNVIDFSFKEIYEYHKKKNNEFYIKEFENFKDLPIHLMFGSLSEQQHQEWNLNYLLGTIFFADCVATPNILFYTEDCVGAQTKRRNYSNSNKYTAAEFNIFKENVLSLVNRCSVAYEKQKKVQSGDNYESIVEAETLHIPETIKLFIPDAIFSIDKSKACKKFFEEFFIDTNDPVAIEKNKQNVFYKLDEVFDGSYNKVNLFYKSGCFYLEKDNKFEIYFFPPRYEFSKYRKKSDDVN